MPQPRRVDKETVRLCRLCGIRIAFLTQELLHDTLRKQQTMLKILLTDPMGNGSKYALADAEGAQFVLGRAEDCDMVIANDDSLSRYHALVRFEQGHWVIRDNNSVNGIRLGKLPVLFTSLSLGTVITIGGGTTLEVIAAGNDTPTAQATAQAPAPRKRYATRGMKRAGGKTQGTPRRLAAQEVVEQPVGQSAESLGLPRDFPLQFFLAEPRHAVTAGSVLRFGFMAAEDCCIYLVQHDSMGGISLILPTQEGEAAELHARRATALPPKSFLVSDELVAGPPFGTDTIVAIACERPCAFAAHLNALLAGEHPTAPGAVEKLVLERCDAELPDGATPPRRSSAVLQIETKA